MKLEFLEREGGHILILTVLFVLCLDLLLIYPNEQFLGKAADMLLGALLFCMKGNSQPISGNPAGEKPKE